MKKILLIFLFAVLILVVGIGFLNYKNFSDPKIYSFLSNKLGSFYKLATATLISPSSGPTNGSCDYGNQLCTTDGGTQMCCNINFSSGACADTMSGPKCCGPNESPCGAAGTDQICCPAGTCKDPLTPSCCASGQELCKNTTCCPTGKCDSSTGTCISGDCNDDPNDPNANCLGHYLSTVCRQVDPNDVSSGYFMNARYQQQYCGPYEDCTTGPIREDYVDTCFGDADPRCEDASTVVRDSTICITQEIKTDTKGKTCFELNNGLCNKPLGCLQRTTVVKNCGCAVGGIQCSPGGGQCNQICDFICSRAPAGPARDDCLAACVPSCLSKVSGVNAHAMNYDMCNTPCAGGDCSAPWPDFTGGVDCGPLQKVCVPGVGFDLCVQVGGCEMLGPNMPLCPYYKVWPCMECGVHNGGNNGNNGNNGGGNGGWSCDANLQCAQNGGGLVCDPAQNGADCGQTYRCNGLRQCVLGLTGRLCDIANGNVDCDVSNDTSRCNNQNQCSSLGEGVVCTNDGDCASVNSTSRCTGTGATSTCDTTGSGALCSSDAECRAGLSKCNSNGRCSTTGNGSVCTTDADCVVIENGCMNGQCMPGGVEGPCTTDTDCKTFKCNDQYQCSDTGTGKNCDPQISESCTPTCNTSGVCEIGAMGANTCSMTDPASCNPRCSATHTCVYGGTGIDCVIANGDADCAKTCGVVNGLAVCKEGGGGVSCSSDSQCNATVSHLECKNINSRGDGKCTVVAGVGDNECSPENSTCCVPSRTRSCTCGGTQTCQSDGTWSDCSMQTICALDNYGDRTCQCSNGAGQDECTVIGAGCPCDEGDTKQCFCGGEQVCDANGLWSDCPTKTVCNELGMCECSANQAGQNECQIVNAECPCTDGEVRTCPCGGTQECIFGGWSNCPEKHTECVNGFCQCVDGSGQNACETLGAVCPCTDGEINTSCGSEQCGFGVSTCFYGAWGPCVGPTQHRDCTANGTCGCVENSGFNAQDLCFSNSTCEINSAPTLEISATPGLYCAKDVLGFSSVGLVYFNWQYSDAENDAQTKYQLQISTDPAFDDNITFDTGLQTGSVTSVNLTVSARSMSSCKGVPSNDGSYIGCNFINYGDSYYWRVKVWDSAGKNSGWVNYSGTYTYDYAHPSPDIIYSVPTGVEPGGEATFLDVSNCWKVQNGNVVQTDCSQLTNCSAGSSCYQWWFKIPTSASVSDYLSTHSADSTFQGSPTTGADVYNTAGTYKTALKICDEIGCCFLPQTIRIGSSNASTLPQWQEISPFK